MIKTIESIMDEAKVLRIAIGLGIDETAEIIDGDGKRVRIKAKAPKSTW